MQAAELDRGLNGDRARRRDFGEAAAEPLPWSRPARLLFLVLAAAFCWAAPVLILYFVAA